MTNIAIFFAIVAFVLILIASDLYFDKKELKKLLELERSNREELRKHVISNRKEIEDLKRKNLRLNRVNRYLLKNLDGCRFKRV
jgi:DNA-binding transcriptional MerR regulator